MASDARLSRIPQKKSTISSGKRSSSIQGSSARASSSAARRSNSNGPSSRFQPSSLHPQRITPQEFIKDPRPINEKKFKDLAFQKLVSFLTMNNYPHKIKPTQISNSEFKRIFEFMISLILPGFKVNRLEEDVPRMMRLLGYPFTISKTTIMTIGSLHSWPQLLACLDFLCEHIRIQLCIEPDDDNFENQIISEYYKKCYDTYFTQNSNSLDFPEHNQWLEDALIGPILNEHRVEQIKYDELLASVNSAKSLLDKNHGEIGALIDMKNDRQKMIIYNNNYMEHNNQQRLFLEREKIEVHEYKQRILELKNIFIEKEQKYKAQKQMGHLLTDLKHDHKMFTKLIKTKSDELAQYNLEKSKLVQKNSELIHEMNEELSKVSLRSQMMGINNPLLTTNFSDIQNEAQLSDLIKKLMTFFVALRTQHEEECRQLEYAVAHRSTEFGMVETDKFVLEQDLNTAIDEISQLENVLVEKRQMRQDLMLRYNELLQLSNRLKKEEADLQELIDMVDAEKIAIAMRKKERESCVQECEYYLELTKSEYQNKLKEITEYFHHKSQLLEVLSKF